MLIIDDMPSTTAASMTCPLPDDRSRRRHRAGTRAAWRNSGVVVPRVHGRDPRRHHASTPDRDRLRLRSHARRQRLPAYHPRLRRGLWIHGDRDAAVDPHREDRKTRATRASGIWRRSSRAPFRRGTVLPWPRSTPRSFIGPPSRSATPERELQGPQREPESRRQVERSVAGRAAMRDTRSNRLRTLWRTYRGTLRCLLFMLGFRSAWADWVTVPTGSMNPTILEGDRLLVDKHAFGLRLPFTRIHLTAGEDPARGDIVVFDSPADGTSLVKRVVGVPGDTVELKGDRLIVNGRPARYSAGDESEARGLV